LPFSFSFSFSFSFFSLPHEPLPESPWLLYPVRRQHVEATLLDLTTAGAAPSTSADGAANQLRNTAKVRAAEQALQELEQMENTLDMGMDDEDDPDFGGDDQDAGSVQPAANDPPSSPSGTSSSDDGDSASSASSDDGPLEADTDSEDERDDLVEDAAVVGEIGLEHPNLSQPAFANSPHTLKACLLLIMKHCIDNKITMEALEHLLQILRLLLPQPNLIPRSKYLLFQLLGIEVESYERHVCEKDCHVFAPLDPSEYYAHENDACPVCQRPRFKRHGASLAPVKKFYVIPIQQQIALLKRNPEFDESTARMWEELGEDGATFYDTFWKGSLAEPIFDRMEDGATDFARILAFSLGLDGVQVFGHGHYEVWPVGLRIWNVHPEQRGKKDFVILAALIPGPKHPDKFSPYLQPLLEEINRSRHNGGLQTWNGPREEVERLEFHLATTQQDMPALAKSSEHIGPSGRCNCHRCRRPSEPNPGQFLFFFFLFLLLLLLLFSLLDGSPTLLTPISSPAATNRGVYQAGYLDGTAFNAPRKTDGEARGHSQSVGQGDENATQYGIKAPSLIATMLPEFDIVYGHMIEFFHDLQIVSSPSHLKTVSTRSQPCYLLFSFQNCPKSFWKDYIFAKQTPGNPLPPYAMTVANRAVFSLRIGSCVATHDMDRRPRDPSKQKMKGDPFRQAAIFLTTPDWRRLSSLFYFYF